MDSTELGHRVISVVKEHPLVQFLCTVEADRGINREVAGYVQVAHEFVEEQPSERLGTSAVPGEQRALHDLWQIDKCEHWPIEVREVTTKDVGLVRCEGLWDVDGHGHVLYEGETATTGIPTIVWWRQLPAVASIEITIIGSPCWYSLRSRASRSFD